MIYKPLQAAWKGLRSGAKGALSGSSTTKFNKLKTAAVGTFGLLGTASIIKHTSTARQRQDQLKFKSRSNFRGF